MTNAAENQNRGIQFLGPENPIEGLRRAGRMLSGQDKETTNSLYSPLNVVASLLLGVGGIILFKAIVEAGRRWNNRPRRKP